MNYLSEGEGTNSPGGLNLAAGSGRIRIADIRLTEDWYACDVGHGTVLALPALSGEEHPFIRPSIMTEESAILADPSGMITLDLGALEDRGDPVYLPAGRTVTCWQDMTAFGGYWKLLHAGRKCAESSASSSSSPSSPSSPSSSPSSGSSGPSSEGPSSEGPSSEGPSSEGPSSEGPCACIPHPPDDSGESAELEAVLGAAAADFFWEPSADGNRTLRHGIPDRNRQEVYNGTSGTATFFQPEQGVNYKKVLCHLNAFVGTVNFYFPANFTVAPIVTAAIDSGAGLTVTLDSMAITTGTPYTGWYIIEGW